MKEKTLLLAISFFANVYVAALPNYYPNSLQNNDLKNSELKAELHKVLISIHQKNIDAPDSLVTECEGECYQQKNDISYKEARKYLFGKLHLEEDNGRLIVRDAYCKKSFTTNAGVGRMRIPDHTKVNCEHTWPQSRFNSKFSRGLQKTDLHHLYPTDSRANSTRGNQIFGEVSGQSISDDCLDSHQGTIINGSTSAFQPPVNHRGNIARALFYFSVRYHSPISAEEEEYLRRWHREDPVDEFESWRNDEIMKIQGNRNPFIDAPELVDQIENF